MTSHTCSFIRKSSSKSLGSEEKWFKYSETVVVSVNATSLTVRDRNNNSLICDLPIHSIAQMEFSDIKIVRIILKDQANIHVGLALQFIDVKGVKALLNELKVYSYPVSKCKQSLSNILNKNHKKMKIFPSLKDPYTHTLLFNIIFDKDFTQYTHDLELILKKLNDKTKEIV